MNLIKWRHLILRKANTSQSNIFELKYFSTNTRKNHYDCLGVTPSATIGEIKTAYYRLSMQYHPDKNKGTEASEKFRDINNAYEVLGNFKLKKLYDKGLLGPYGVSSRVHNVYEQMAEEEQEDDAQTKFYKARMKRSEAPHVSGRQPIYNFDEWSKSHYGVNLNRHLKAKRKLEQTMDVTIDQSNSFKTEVLIFGILFVVLTIIYVDFFHSQHSLDQITEKNVKVASDSSSKEK